MGTAYRTDPVLAVIEPESVPAAFLTLPDEEQRWRGRLFVAVMWLSHHAAYSWSLALSQEELVVTDWRRLMDETDDQLLVARWRGMRAEIAIETGVGLTEA